ncbi:Uncharacterised protein [Bordetella pertussis]|nr:Uncharacterised protein [Bordetella pertussis]
MRRRSPRRENTTLWLLSVRLTTGASAPGRTGKVAE